MNMDRDNSTEDKGAIGRRLKAWRKASSMTLMKLGKIVSVSQASLSELENGKSLPSAGTLRNLCLNTNINLYWLLTGRESMSRETAKDQVAVPADFAVILRDHKLKDLVECLIRIYQRGGAEKAAHLYGFMYGADPGLGYS